MDEFFDVRMVAAQDAHLGSATGTGRLNGFTGAVENTHVGNRAGSAGVGAFDVGTLRTNTGEVIADTTATAHGFSRFGQCGVNAGAAIGHFNDGVANRLHEAVDQGGVDVGASR